jgi:hypothetical protein
MRRTHAIAAVWLALFACACARAGATNEAE